MRRGLAVIAGVVGAGLLIGGAQLWQSQARARATVAAAELPEVNASLTAAPAVPPPVDRPGNAKVIVNLETTETKGTLADGVQYTFWTFGGTVPGPFVRVRVGDVVQIRMKNAEKSMQPHSIDLHAVTGPGAGQAYKGLVLTPRHIRHATINAAVSAQRTQIGNAFPAGLNSAPAQFQRIWLKQVAQR